jgi:NADH dehydrogenase
MQPTSTQIVLLGGGYVSVWAYRSLVRRLRSELQQGKVQITVICPNTHHAFHGWTVETLTGILQCENQVSPLTEIMPKANLITAQADCIDPTSKQVIIHLPDGSSQAIAYDHLLMGIGSFDNDSIEGIRQYGYQIKAHNAFHKTKDAIQERVQKAATASPAVAQKLLTFTVAGGGFTGVELATNLVEYLNVLKKDYPTLNSITPKVRLVHSGEHVLPSLQTEFRRLVNYAEQTMKQYGIEVINNRCITEITEEGVYLNDASFLASSMVISTVGQSRIQIPGLESVPRDSQQRLYTNVYQQLLGHTTIWGGGDACHVKHYQTRDACPANALWAIKHGEYVGRNIARAVKGKPLKPFTYKGLGQSASLGLGKGITELYGIPFTGVIAWLMRWFFFNYFMPSRRVMLRGVGDWLYLATRGKRKGLTTKQVNPTPQEQLAAYPA